MGIQATELHVHYPADTTSPAIDKWNQRKIIGTGKVCGMKQQDGDYKQHMTHKNKAQDSFRAGGTGTRGDKAGEITEHRATRGTEKGSCNEVDDWG